MPTSAFAKPAAEKSRPLEGPNMRMNNRHKTFDIIDYLARDTAKSPDLKIDDDTVKGRQDKAGVYTDRVAARSSATQSDQAVATQSESEDASAPRLNTYCSLLTRAVSELPNNTREARQALYDRSGVAFAAELQQNSELSEAQVAHERADFERAIRIVERNARRKKEATRDEQEHRWSLSSLRTFFGALRRF
jgi:hypothetical protein